MHRSLATHRTMSSHHRVALLYRAASLGVWRLALTAGLLCAAWAALGGHAVYAQAPEGRLSVSVACPAGPVQMGSRVEVAITVTNTGDAALTNVTVRDPLLGLAEQVGTLEPGASALVGGAHDVSEADVPTGLAPDATLFTISSTVEADSDQTGPQTAAWSIDVEYWFSAVRAALGLHVSGPTTVQVGETATFRVTVSNIGDVSLANVRVVSERLGLDAAIDTLERGAAREYSATVGPLTDADLPGPLAVTAAAWSDRAERVEARCETAVRPAEPAPPAAAGRADLAVVVRGAGAGTAVHAWVGGTAQPVLYTAANALGEAQATWTFYIPEGQAWTVRVSADPPAGWDVRAPGGDTVQIAPGDRRTIYLDVAPRQEPLLPMPAGDAPTLAPAPLLPQAGAWSAGVDRMHRICRMSTLHVMA